MLKTVKARKLDRSKQLYKEAQELMPGGVNSPVRAFKSVGSEPIFISKAKGSRIWDEDGNEYIDYVGSWGPMILGHADPDIESALASALKNGTSFGAPTELENLMAEEVIKTVPSIEMVRMVNSGTEAVMGALRLARAYTKRDKIVKFAGCYHGHADAMLVQAGSGVATLGLPDSPGVTKLAAQNTITVPFNDRDALKKVFESESFDNCDLAHGVDIEDPSYKHKCDIAAIIVEPVIGNGGCIPPEPGFLEFLREITSDYGALLIFDEVMTGFRVALGGAQQHYNVMPDITTLGKIIGGGLPVGAYGGPREIMSMVAPSGPMYQAGTLSGNPLAMTAGLTCLRKIQEPNFYKELDQKAKYLIAGLKAAHNEIHQNQQESRSETANETVIPEMQFSQVGGMFGFFFRERSEGGGSQPIRNFAEAKNTQIDFFKKYHAAMLEQGVYLAPSAFEAGFMSAAHSYDDLDQTIEAHKQALKTIN